MFKVLFTQDYEIHGSGMGSPAELIVEPTQRMLDQFDKYGAKLTIMADMAEILKFKEFAEETGRDDFAYHDIVAQLRRAITTGHDVQLHMHSSYFKAVHENGSWRQCYDEYDLANLEPTRLLELITLSKSFLEELLLPVAPDYRCFAFRAANWSMVPSRSICRALQENGITIDTSVFKYGIYEDLVHFDYSSADSALVPWPVDENDVCRRDPAGRLFEFPIFCERQPIWTFLTANRVYRVVAERLNPLPKEADAVSQAAGGPPLSLPAKLFKVAGMLVKPHPWKMDFNQCSGKQLIGGLKRAQRKYGGRKPTLPFVIIGHSKTYTHFNQWSLKPFLEYVQNCDYASFGTFGDFDLEDFR